MTDSARADGPRRAVALRYDGQSAPRVVAKGGGEIAERILEVAREHGVPLREDQELVGLLSQIDLGDEIPTALYVAVAEILAFAYRLSGKLPAAVSERSSSDALANAGPRSG